ncbi:hypothetical protein C8J55DRAFT_554695 [Lentinula edodes]|uniref:Uncharacterized protein n=1 Tax=Lentinula lateritia TaxID=40482 RepID=A0A9W9B319_9AGAR|nr:hypothetical protein C8J55DRAFT_554695 [Lentinula edodes]
MSIFPHIHSILYNTILKQAASASSSSSVASIQGLPLDDISVYVGNQAPVAAAVYGARPVAFVARVNILHAQLHLWLAISV